ncbi:MAG: MATE family efflux transporter [Candidatus Falkowbacteria bacterium]|nr:MATE family efflux transporter [Candidatus Falkowbacteria bacterium]
MKITKKGMLAFCLSLIYLALLTGAVRPTLAASTLWGQQTGMQDVGSNAYGQTDPEDIRITVVKIINTVLLFLAIIMLALVLFSGFKYMTSGGNEQKVSEALGYIKNATIGLVIVLMAWAISFALLMRLRAITSGQTSYLYGPWY